MISLFTSYLQFKTSNILYGSLYRRVIFKWLPIAFSNDLVHGAWYFIIGSLITALIPVFPLIALYENIWDSYEVETVGLPNSWHAVAYSLLIVSGVFFTIGSYAFLRAVKPIRPSPLFTWYHFQSDELFGMWMFFLGTLPSVPLLAIYVYFNPHSAIFGIGVIVCLLFTAVMLLAVFTCYPIDDDKCCACQCCRRREFVAPILHCCIPQWCCLRKHLANDWLIVSWGLFIGCILTTILLCALVYVAVEAGSDRLIYDYVTSLVDMIIFTIGCMYFLAGSYPDETSSDSGKNDWDL
jgi:hypothetical protein